MEGGIQYNDIYPGVTSVSNRSGLKLMCAAGMSTDAADPSDGSFGPLAVGESSRYGDGRRWCARKHSAARRFTPFHIHDGVGCGAAAVALPASIIISFVLASYLVHPLVVFCFVFDYFFPIPNGGTAFYL